MKRRRGREGGLVKRQLEAVGQIRKGRGSEGGRGSEAGEGGGVGGKRRATCVILYAHERSRQARSLSQEARREQMTPPPAPTLSVCPPPLPANHSPKSEAQHASLNTKGQLSRLRQLSDSIFSSFFSSFFHCSN